MTKIQIDERAEFARVERLMREEDTIFVFGSNLAGIHGAGAAKVARDRYGARFGQGVGLAGRSYAVPTKDANLVTLPRTDILGHVKRLKLFAELAPRLIFATTRIGCGLAGFTDEEIAPLFVDAPLNMDLPLGWREFNGE